MNHDSELLELAAKAAGIYVKAWNHIGYAITFDERGRPVGWNSLQDDGDALRLAVKLGMIVVIQDSGCVSAEVPGYEMVCEYAHSTASTRRAITRAAAEIGKAMP